jgi:O-methyltransferase
MLGRLRTALRGRRSGAEPATPLDELSPADRSIVERALPYTLTGPARLRAVIDASRYCVARGLDGAFAECGVWRGGSVLAMVLTLQELGRTDRDLYLYDTFEGMTEPSERDVSSLDPPALSTWNEARERGEQAWSEYFDPELTSEEAVSKLLHDTGYPAGRLHVVRGPVESTLPARAPERLALLRLDTDWYESTKHELEQLYPRLVPGGVLIVDDYGHWEGARQAVDEYFARHGPAPLLQRVDYTCRMAVKA